MLAGQLFVTEVRQPSMQTTTWHFLSKCHLMVFHSMWAGSYMVSFRRATQLDVLLNELRLTFSLQRSVRRWETHTNELGWVLNRTQFPQKPRSGRDCCLFWLQHIIRTHWRNQSTPSDTLGIERLEMPVWSFFFLLRKLLGILKRVTHAIIFGLLGLR